MKKFKLTAVVCLLLSCFTVFNAYAAGNSRGEKSAGILAGYASHNESPVAGVFFQYSVIPYLRLAPDITYFIRNHGADALGFNVNVQVPIELGVTGKFDVYPMAGFNYTSWSVHNKTVHNDKDVTTRMNHLGLNVGAGVECNVTKTLKLLGEYKFTLSKKHFSTSVVSIGIGYNF